MSVNTAPKNLKTRQVFCICSGEAEKRTSIMANLLDELAEVFGIEIVCITKYAPKTYSQFI